VPKGKAGIMGRWEIEDGRWKMEAKKGDGCFFTTEAGREDRRWKQKKKGGVFLWPFNSQKERWIRCD